MHYYFTDGHGAKRSLTILRNTQNRIILRSIKGSSLSLVRYCMTWEGPVKGRLRKHEIHAFPQRNFEESLEELGMSFKIEDGATSGHGNPPQTIKAAHFCK